MAMHMKAWHDVAWQGRLDSFDSCLRLVPLSRVTAPESPKKSRQRVNELLRLIRRGEENCELLRPFGAPSGRGEDAGPRDSHARLV